MSRDITPKEWEQIHKEFPELDPINNNIFVFRDGKTKKYYSDADIKFMSNYPKLRLVGLNLLFYLRNNRLFTDNKKIIDEIEQILEGKDSNNEKLKENLSLWYDGELVPGYYLHENDLKFISIIETLS